MFSDWSQSNFGDSQPPDLTNTVPASQSTASRAPASLHSRTPSTASKRSATSDIEPPWSSKRAKTTGPESILALGRSVDGIGKDMHDGYIMSDERTRLNILFGRDTSAADAYISDEDPFLRAETGRELLNPTQNFNYH
ncbi:hypothetical protein B0H11DRAFT_2234472 [Mycena galericulata]|nr:hypothetical protein B0H11DRAFT_2234472 [Mycena galericulata]